MWVGSEGWLQLIFSCKTRDKTGVFGLEGKREDEGLTCLPGLLSQCVSSECLLVLGAGIMG